MREGSRTYKPQKKRKKRRDEIDKKESDRHLTGKRRICKIFRDRGFKATTEQRFPCYVELGDFIVKYRADVFAHGKGRKIIAEVDGYKGHKTARSRILQELRLRRIRETYGQKIEEYRFTLKRLSAWNDREIAEEMRL